MNCRDLEVLAERVGKLSVAAEISRRGRCGRSSPAGEFVHSPDQLVEIVGDMNRRACSLNASTAGVARFARPAHDGLPILTGEVGVLLGAGERTPFELSAG